MEVEEFDVTDFEKRLSNLKDTQDSIQNMSNWCLKHRPNHKKVVSSWLNVLKQVKVEHRLTLFHLANDVIQHSKRKNFEFVDSWGTTLQRATTLVRDEKVKNKIIRIFNIWEQRGIYNDEFLADLHGLLSINPTKKQQQMESDDEQQASILSMNIRNCVRLEKETDKSFKVLTRTPLCDTDNIHTLKDRKHVEDVESEIAEHASKLENYLKSLHAEIKSRTILIAVLEQTDAFYHNQRGEVKVVANAYRNFGNRIKTMKRKLDELVPKLLSPIPSPDINAPSPEPDNDFDLPELGAKGFDQNLLSKESNGFLSYMDGGSLPFDINDFKSESPKTDAQPIQVIGSSTTATKDLTDFNIDEFFKSIMPDSYTPSPVPQPVPPVDSDYNMPQSIYADLPSINDYASPQSGGPYRPILPPNSYRSVRPQQHVQQAYVTPLQRPHYNRPPNPSFNHSYNPQMNNYHPRPPAPRYPSNNNNYNMPLAPPPIPPAFEGNMSDEYNPESWDMEMSWNSEGQESSFEQTIIDTPASPPHFEQEGTGNVREYIERNEDILSCISDVDHRQLQLPNIPISSINKEKIRALDVDHRNLIPLTGSPGPATSMSPDEMISKPLLPPPLQPPNLWKGDVDLRQNPMGELKQNLQQQAKEHDFDYKSNYNIESNKYNNFNRQSNQSSNLNKTTSPPSSSQINKTEEQHTIIPPLQPPQFNRMDEFLDIPKNVFDSSSNSPTHSEENSGTYGLTNISKISMPPPLVPPPSLPIFASPPPILKHDMKSTKGLRKGHRDNVESIDMEMSDEDFEDLQEFIEYEDDEINEKTVQEIENDLIKDSNDQDDRVLANFVVNKTDESKADDDKDNKEYKEDKDMIDCFRHPPPTQKLFENKQFERPPFSMFNSPPPVFVRPLLMTPNFPPNNRMWSPKMNMMPHSPNRFNRPPLLNVPKHFSDHPTHSNFNVGSANEEHESNTNESISSQNDAKIDNVEKEHQNLQNRNNPFSRNPGDFELLQTQSNNSNNNYNSVSNVKEMNRFMNKNEGFRQSSPQTQNQNRSFEQKQRQNPFSVSPRMQNFGGCNNMEPNQPPPGHLLTPPPQSPQPLFSPGVINQLYANNNNSPMRGGHRGGGMGPRGGNGSPYYRPRGGGRNRGNFNNNNFRGNNNNRSGNW